jgi:hypothetical protein
LPSELKQGGSFQINNIDLIGLLRLTWGGLLQVQRAVEELTGEKILTPTEQINQNNKNAQSYLGRIFRRLRRLWGRK